MTVGVPTAYGISVSGVQIDAISHSSARVGWMLSQPASSYLEYGKTTSYGYRTVTLDPNSEPSRVWLLTGMAPGTTYHFRVKAIDPLGAVAYSPDYMVTTQPAPVHPVLPELPRAYVDTTMPLQTGVTLPVAADCRDLTAALDRATWGDTVVIPAGTTCTGRFIFPAKPPDTQIPHRWIVIRTSAPDSTLPPDGVRISPAWRSQMARLALNSTALPNETDAGAHHYRFIGIEFTTADPSAYYEGSLLRVSGSSHHIVIDRCYLHGYDYPGATARALIMDGAHVALINSYVDIANYQYYGFALLVHEGPGPGKVQNNFIQGPGITLFWTDNSPAIQSDYEIRRNWIYANDRYRQGSPTSDGRRYMHRQPLELKRGRRFVIDGNIFDNWWADEQGGAETLVFTPRGGFRFDGNEFEISDITISNNLLRKVAGGVSIAAINGVDAGGYQQTRVTKRFRIANNLALIDGFHACCGWVTGARGLTLRLQGGVEDVTFEHNTVYRQTGSGPRLLSLNDEAMEGLVYRNNIVWFNNANQIGGLFFNGQYPTGGLIPFTPKGILDGWAVRIPDPSYIFSNNVIPGAEPGDTARYQGQFPPGNFWPGDGVTGENAIMFQNPTAGNFRLRAESPYKRVATDGQDVGVNMNVLESALGKVQSVSVVTSTAAAQISYVAPDSFACTVELSRFLDFRQSLRKRDAGGSNLSRSTMFINLLPGVSYYYRVLCASDQPAGMLKTRSSLPTQ